MSCACWRKKEDPETAALLHTEWSNAVTKSWDVHVTGATLGLAVEPHPNESVGDTSLPHPARAFQGKGVVDIAGCHAHGAALTAMGTVLVWNSAGKEEEVRSPKPVACLAEWKIVEIAVGAHALLALTALGSLFVCEFNDTEERISTFATPPQKVGGLGGRMVKHVALSETAALCVTADGCVFSWGTGLFGELGMDHPQQEAAVPGLLTALPAAAVTLACGRHHVAALLDNGDVWTWGAGANGQLGHEIQWEARHPQRVEGLVGQKVVQISCGGTFSAARTHEGRVFTWGNGVDGALGHGDRIRRMVPRQVVEFGGRRRRASDISCGARSMMAVTTEHDVFAWGYNLDGRLGVGDTVDKTRPTLVLYFLGKRVLRVRYNGSTAFALTKLSPLSTRHVG